MNDDTTSPRQDGAPLLTQEEVDRILAPLNEQEREALRLRFGLDRGQARTLEEVATALGLERAEVRAIEARALGKLRDKTGL